ncbi:sugar-binding transcriptional regulator [Microbacterium sp. NPDC055903]
MNRKLALDAQVMHAYVAVQHLARGRAIGDIAEEIGRSRFATARMVRRAREMGLIEVRPVLPAALDLELSARLVREYGVRAALVVGAVPGREGGVRQRIASVTARLIADTVGEDDVVGFAPGRTLVLASREVPGLPSADAVQLTGVGWPRLEDGLEVVANIGRASRGAVFPLAVPLLVDPAARSVLEHPSIRQTIGRFDHVCTAFLTIGGWPDASLLARRLAETGERDALMARGAVAEFGTSLLDIDGRAVEGLEDRFVGMTPVQLGRVGLRIAIGGGEGKRRAVAAVLRSGLADVIVTDAPSALAALDG